MGKNCVFLTTLIDMNSRRSQGRHLFFQLQSLNLIVLFHSDMFTARLFHFEMDNSKKTSFKGRVDQKLSEHAMNRTNKTHTKQIRRLGQGFFMSNYIF